MIRILIAIPASEYIKTECLKSIIAIDVPNNVTVDVEFVIGYGAAQSRNKAACKAIDLNYDYILFIDSDQIVPVDVLHKLLSCNSDISTGWSMMAINDERTNISIYNAPDMHYDFMLRKDVPEGIIDVDAIGFSCILIKTSVFEKLKYPYFVYVEYSNRTILSEDLYFCNMAKQAGFKILCDTSLNIGHIKTVII